MKGNIHLNVCMGLIKLQDEFNETAGWKRERLNRVQWKDFMNGEVLV